MSTAGELAVFGTMACSVMALVAGIPILIFGGWEYALGAVALIGFCWVIWLLLCGLFRLVGGPE